MAISNFTELITQINAMLTNFASAVGVDVTSANDSGATDFTKAMGTFINTPTSPWTSSTIPLVTTGAVRGGICAVWFKGAVLSESSFTGGSVVLLSGTNVLDELCLVYIMYDKTNSSFVVNIQADGTGTVPGGNPPLAPSLGLTETTFTPSAPPLAPSLGLTETTF